jgi:hypothetical protein
VLLPPVSLYNIYTELECLKFREPLRIANCDRRPVQETLANSIAEESQTATRGA